MGKSRRSPTPMSAFRFEVLKSYAVGLTKPKSLKIADANARYDRDRDLEGDVAQRTATDRIIELIYWADFAIIEAAEVVRSAQIEAIENGHVIAAAVAVDNCQLTLDQEDDVPRQENILCGLQRDAIVLVPSRRARHLR